MKRIIIFFIILFASLCCSISNKKQQTENPNYKIVELKQLDENLKKYGIYPTSEEISIIKYYSEIGDNFTYYKSDNTYIIISKQDSCSFKIEIK